MVESLEIVSNIFAYVCMRRIARVNQTPLSLISGNGFILFTFIDICLGKFTLKLHKLRTYIDAKTCTALFLIAKTGAARMPFSR